MAHEPSGFIGTEAHIAVYLPRANAFLASQHEVDNAKPIAERLIRVFENRPCDMREAIAFRRTSVALPMPRLRGNGLSLCSTAARAADTFWPALADEVSTTSVFVGEHRLELGDAHLMDLRELFCPGHNDLSFVGKNVA